MPTLHPAAPSTHLPNPSFSEPPRSLPSWLTRTGSRKRRGKRAPLISWKAFVKAHHKVDQRLIPYLDHPPRKDSVPVSPQIRDEMRAEAAIFLPANNMLARINFAEIFVRRLEEFADSVAGTHFFWTTLTLSKFMLPEAKAKTLDLREVQKAARRLFKGLNFIGIVEPALYTYLANLGTRERYVCWHVHFIAWDTSEDRIQKARDRINRNNEAFIPEIPPAYYRLVSRLELAGVALYMLKAPQSDHRVFPQMVEMVERATGEIIKVPTGRYRQRKGELRLGLMARIAEFMGGRCLDQLTFANGKEGKALHKAGPKLH